MIETIVLDYLNTNLFPVEAYTEIPINAPKEYVTIEVIDMGESNRIPYATIEVMSYAQSMYDASSLNNQVIEAMREIDQVDDIVSCKRGGGSNETDTERKTYCYRSVFNIVYYE